MATGTYQGWVPKTPAIYERGAIAFPEAAAQTFMRGTPVIKDANGRITAAGASPAVLFGVTLDAGHNAAAGQYDCLVYPFQAGDEWVIPLLETLAQSQFGSANDAGVVKDGTTNFWYLSTADPGAQFALKYFEGGPAGPAIGDTKAQVVAAIHSAKIQGF